MWLFQLFKLSYIFSVSLLPVIIDTGVQVCNGIEIKATDFGRTEEWNRIEPEETSDLELRTRGPAGEWAGSAMGVFQLLHTEDEDTEDTEDEANGLVYKQRHDGDGDIQYYLYRVDQWWCVSSVIGERSGYLMARAGSLSQTTPPRKGWQYIDGTHWHHDPDMECGKPSLQCKSVSVVLSGDVDYYQGQSAGRYAVISGLWSRGREVFRQESSPHNYLTVATGVSSWGIRSSIDTKLRGIKSASAGTACPSSPSASISKRNGRNSWQYYKKGPWYSPSSGGFHNGEIEVRCFNCYIRLGYDIGK